VPATAARPAIQIALKNDRTGLGYQTRPPFEMLRGDLKGALSRRVNIQHHLVYQVLEEIRTVKVIRMWTHYE
jgi:Txe/YoeB family toxin of toxin-antitoxin system